jgi:indole-3-glycerol phosphate synthase
MNILDQIVLEKRHEVAALPPWTPSVTGLKAALDGRGDRRDFMGALRHPRRGSVALIAEVKKASPSAGVICQDFDPARIAREYEEAGATCLSVLTDEKFFQGSLLHLMEVRAAVGLPLLRKDFIIDARQVLECAAFGADAILLIAAILTDAELRDLHDLATGAGLAALVEVHDETELDRALAVGAQLIGVNNRDLRVFQTDLATTERLGRRLRAAPGGAERLLVAESGIRTRSDVERLRRATAQAILVGESLLRDGSPGANAAELLRE